MFVQAYDVSKSSSFLYVVVSVRFPTQYPIPFTQPVSQFVAPTFKPRFMSQVLSSKHFDL